MNGNSIESDLNSSKKKKKKRLETHKPRLEKIEPYEERRELAKWLPLQVCELSIR